MATDDFKVIEAVLKGDREAYAELVRDYHTRVLSLCLSMLGDRAEAEDAAQDAFVKAFAALRQYRRNVSFSAWIYRIASNHCLDVLRKRKRQRTDSLDGILDQQGDQFELAGGPEEPGFEQRETTAMALQVLETLSPDHRQILVLRELNELRYEEIAVVLKCSLDAVKSRLRRARAQLQEKARHLLDRKAFKL